MIKLIDTAPKFGVEAIRPEIQVEIYQARLCRAVQRMGESSLDFLLVYGDREHSANLAYLTGFDPRFEEALLLLGRDGRKLLIVGNECMGYLPDSRLGCEIALFQEFSLMGQPRGDSRPLSDILSEFGIGAGSRAGCVGWKCYDPRLVSSGAGLASDLPGYLIDLLRQRVGNPGRVTNATDLFSNPADGLRVMDIEPEQIAQFEYASIQTSEAVRTLLENLREGVMEQELERLLVSAGLPLSCHRMISFGAKAQRGLASPSQNRARLGDPYTVAFGVTGALTCRAGCIARGPEDLPASDRDFYAAFAANYFDVVTTWYQNIRVGAPAGEVHRAVESRRDDRLYRFAVNPGHYLHLDEWVHSPFSADSRITLRSGTALQMDIIPVSKGPFHYINAEDGIILADASLRHELAERFPACWSRMQARRTFMHTLGIELDESVLPLSNIPACLPPYALSPGRVLANA